MLCVMGNEWAGSAAFDSILAVISKQLLVRIHSWKEFILRRARTVYDSETGMVCRPLVLGSLPAWVFCCYCGSRTHCIRTKVFKPLRQFQLICEPFNILSFKLTRKEGKWKRDGLLVLKIGSSPMFGRGDSNWGRLLSFHFIDNWRKCNL